MGKSKDNLSSKEVIEKSFKVKSVTISRKRNDDQNGFKSAFIGLFEENNPHLKGNAPLKVLEFKEIEKIRIRDLRNISYYLMGNDLIINNLEQVNIRKEGNIIFVTGIQNLPE